MSSYNELIKNFEKIRAYMREFYVYGFKSRDGYDQKSARSYDDERRRIESWLGDHMQFVRTAEGKNVFLSIDSRTSFHNPLHKAWKTKSFTSGDITLHFILFDILHDESTALSLREIMTAIDEDYMSDFEDSILFDESTVRKKLKEYCEEGIITCEKQGKKTLYKRAKSPSLPPSHEALHFFSETAPCGVVGSFLLDKYPEHKDILAFKHHYITGALDSAVLEALFCAMREKRAVTLTSHSRRNDTVSVTRVVPLRIFISVQSGRQHLLAYVPSLNRISSLRVDYISEVSPEDVTPRFDELRSHLALMQKKMWGVSVSQTFGAVDKLEQVEFTVRVAPSEDYIINRLIREKRTGNVEKIDDGRYRFSAEVCDANELIPWIRTFICRIEELNISNKEVERRFKADLEQMYRLYGIKEETV